MAPPPVRRPAGRLCRGNRRIDEDRQPRRSRHERTQQFQPFCGQLGIEEIDTGQVALGRARLATRPEPDRVFGDAEDDGIIAVAAFAPAAGASEVQSRRPALANRPPTPPSDRSDCRPSGSRSPRCRPRRSRPLLGPDEMRADVRRSYLATKRRESRRLGSRAVAREPRAAKLPPRPRGQR